MSKLTFEFEFEFELEFLNRERREEEELELERVMEEICTPLVLTLMDVSYFSFCNACRSVVFPTA